MSHGSVAWTRVRKVGGFRASGSHPLGSSELTYQRGRLGAARLFQVSQREQLPVDEVETVHRLLDAHKSLSPLKRLVEVQS